MKCKARGSWSSVSQVSIETKDFLSIWCLEGDSSGIPQAHHLCQDGNWLYLPSRMPSGWLDLVHLCRVGATLNIQLEAVLSQRTGKFSPRNWDQRKCCFAGLILWICPMIILGNLGLTLSGEQKILMVSRRLKFLCLLYT